MPDYPKEQLWELYKNLPEDLQKAAFSEDVARNIREICVKNEVFDDDTIFEVAKNIGYVFLGLLPPNEFSYVLEKELKLDKGKAEEIASETARYVFLPVRTSLEALYKIEIKPGIKPKTVPLSPEAISPKEKLQRKDVYRETIE